MSGIKNKLSFDDVKTRIPFLSCLSKEEFQKLKIVLKERIFPKKSIIISADDTSNYMYIILSGEVKVVHTGDDGKERILAMHKTGDYFGEMALLDGKTSPATVKAVKKSSIVLISKTVFQEHLLKNDKVLREINTMLCQRLRESWAIIKVLGIPDAEDRIRSFLMLMSTKGTEVFGGKVIKGGLTHQTIADHLSLSRETVTRVLNKLEKNREIEVLGGKTILIKEKMSTV